MVRDVTRKCKECKKELEFWEWHSILTYRTGNTALDEVGWQGADVYCEECYKKVTQ
jgi:hypothetical protein